MLSVKQLKDSLQLTENIHIHLPDGGTVPRHFHVTEAGLVTKHFIDCGGTIRKQSALTMQLWYSVDLHHRLTPKKFLKILEKSEPLFNDENLLVEIEYQSNTIGRYNLEFDGEAFHLITTETDCLAKDQCSVNSVSLNKSVGVSSSVCDPGGGCC